MQTRKITQLSMAVLLAGLGLVFALSPLPARADGPPIFLTQWGQEGSGAGQFESPAGVAVASDGSLYVADTGNHRIQKFDSHGAFLHMCGFGVDTGMTTTFQICTAGSLPCQAGESGSGDGQFDTPTGVAVDGAGNVYVVEAGLNFNYCVQNFDISGNYLTKWGSFGSGDGQFNSLHGITVDTSGNVYVVEYPNQRVQKFSNDGTFITKWGSFGSGDGQFYNPDGVAVDEGAPVFTTSKS